MNPTHIVDDFVRKYRSSYSKEELEKFLKIAITVSLRKTLQDFEQKIPREISVSDRNNLQSLETLLVKEGVVDAFTLQLKTFIAEMDAKTL